MYREREGSRTGNPVRQAQKALVGGGKTCLWLLPLKIGPQGAHLHHREVVRKCPAAPSQPKRRAEQRHRCPVVHLSLWGERARRLCWLGAACGRVLGTQVAAAQG